MRRNSIQVGPVGDPESLERGSKTSAQDRGPFWFLYILNESLQYILKYGMNLKFETIIQICRKIIQLNAVVILKNANEYYRKGISKSSRKMDLYPAM